MASSYPGGLDSFTNPTATDTLDSATVPHATQHANANDAIEAIQAELGTDPAGASATVKARFEAIEANNWVTTTRINDSAVTSAKIADGTIVDGDINASAAIAQSKIANLTSDLAGKSPSMCLYLPGTSGNAVTAPDSAGVSITGDIDLRIRLCMDPDWTPAAACDLITKAAGGNLSYGVMYLADGSLRLYWSADGTNWLFAASTANVSASAGDILWIRCTLDVDNGASGNDVKFYTATDTTGSSWTQLGATVTTGGTTSIYDGTATVFIGGAQLIGNMTAKVYRAQILSGIGGTVVADWRGDTPADRYRDEYGNVWTVNGTANGWMVA